MVICLQAVSGLDVGVGLIVQVVITLTVAVVAESGVDQTIAAVVQIIVSASACGGLVGRVVAEVLL